MLLQVSSDCRGSTRGMSFEKMYAWAEWGLERFEEEGTLEAPCFLLFCLAQSTRTKRDAGGRDRVT